MKQFNRYSDVLIIFGVLGGFIFGGWLAYQQWQHHPEEWRTNFDESSINPQAVQVSGMGRDRMIVPIDQPRFESVILADAWLDARSPVIVLSSGTTARAYPLSVMLAHEIVNDVFDEIAIAVTYCPLCNSPIVYKRVIDERVLRMGITGNLYGNNFLMYDDYSESWWHQFTGEAVVGDYTGRRLEVVPSQVVGFHYFAERFPEGDVLAGDARFPQQRYRMNPYMNYDGGESPLISREDYDPRLQALEWVLGLDVAETSIAYPYRVLQDEGVVNDIVAELAVVVFWQAGLASALDAMNLDNSRDVGQAAIYGRIVAGHELQFFEENGRIYDENTGSEWNIFGEAIAGELSGARLEKYACYAQFWFAWSSANPQTEIYQP